MLQETADTLNSPVACCTTAVRAVEAMLAERGYKKGGLKSRIDKAVEKRDLPPDMGKWANEIREIGNESHTDDDPAPLHTEQDAKRSLHFAKMLAHYLFVMPEEIKRGRKKKKEKSVVSAG